MYVWKAVLEMSRTVASGACIKELKRTKHSISISGCSSSSSSSSNNLQRQPYWHWIHTTDSVNVKVQNIFHG